MATRPSFPILHFLERYGAGLCSPPPYAIRNSAAGFNRNVHTASWMAMLIFELYSFWSSAPDPGISFPWSPSTIRAAFALGWRAILKLGMGFRVFRSRKTKKVAKTLAFWSILLFSCNLRKGIVRISLGRRERIQRRTVVPKLSSLGIMYQ
ncbi:hypothetical protein BDP27DRAFT_1332315 [Rhodocollybia butyracea]|uniref:Uncharacterized protein n=1 Tax=Rhodocollybia butyracea TaxID=206335 RepID=A0A9P5PL29_9AGAR|nr:hypothetical protein BDP27DRAFT_1332315 [Rhodocollybia butyracea]